MVYHLGPKGYTFRAIRRDFTSFRPAAAPDCGALRQGGELDFVVRREGHSLLALQVCSQLSDGNRRRELGAFSAAFPYLRQAESLLLSEEGESGLLDHEGVGIRHGQIIPWLLGLPAPEGEG